MKHMTKATIFLSISLGLFACGGGGSTTSDSGTGTDTGTETDTGTGTDTGSGTDTGTPDTNTPQRADLVSSTLLASHAANDMATAVNAISTGNLISAKYGVKNYAITYKTTTTDGELINASGLVSIPQKNGETSPIIAYHHGTILHNDFAPSLNYGATEVESIAASLGYIVVSPDYIGYGASSNYPHPYSNAKTLASSSIDMLRATKQWFADNNISTNGQLFTTGYSEGGYAALATQKSIQEDFPSDFTVTASVPASGSYDMSGTGRLLAQAETLVYPVSVAYVIKNIGTIYNNGLVDDAIKSDFTYIFDSYFDGTHDDDEINNLLGNDPKAWLEESFLNSLVDGTNQTFIPALAENDIYDWTPTAPTRLFHGFDDQVVPYQNSVTALDTMISNGATDIDLVNCSSAIPGFTISPSSHANCSLPYFYYTVMYFDGIAQDL